MRKGLLYTACWIFLLISCAEDLGNYDYREVAEITIENVPEVIEVLGNSDHIVVKPKVVSSLDGEVKEGDANFEFTYKIEKKSGGTMVAGQKWVDLNPLKTLNLDTLAAFAADTYIGWFGVTDKRSGVETSKTFDIKVSSPTYEGWMVLCNEGEQERVRMDMISVISAERVIPAYDVLAPLGFPELRHARGIGFYPNRRANPDDVIYVMSEEGTYRLDRETLQINLIYRESFDLQWRATSFGTALSRWITKRASAQILFYQSFITSSMRLFYILFYDILFLRYR